MKKLIYLFILISFSTAILISCKEGENKKSGEVWKAEHVVFIGLDGWGAYSVEKADMPNVKELMANGCYTLKKRSVLPSSSAVNWASIFMGAGPELHGYTEWGSKVPELPSRELNKNGIFPNIFQLLRDAAPSAEIGVMYEWEGIKYLVDTLSLDYFALAPDYNEHPGVLCEMAEKYILERKPVLTAIIFDNPDHIGHAAGHDTPAYYDDLRELDNYIGRIITAMKESGIYDNSIIIVTSDHGGIGKGHGGKTMAEMETPFIISGKNIRQGGAFNESMMQFDCASTIAHIFNLEQPQVWIGRPMLQVFE
ncbi:MAG TPA: alkaline phosphatase [Bacteroidales bacterium]|jgi:predicted AlkP superfamily pyrophosphatase or phosphodiesterase|nr:alkaline phosphatase [Bacteroidales bacterium]HOS72429.1 alkaline phosphatase [Bacteroidales bacterium]HQH24947.1 alkaline phosphatase [Bacteroidales bacterium]HQJ82351.1 alkaline phosphatase [Bacteroidales bacterium]